MAIAFVQANNSATGTTALSIAKAVSGAQTAGNANIVAVTFGDSNAATVADTVTVTDTKLNTYTAVGATVQFSDGATNADSVQVFYCPSIIAATAGANTITATRTGTGAATTAFLAFAQLEYSGLATSSPVDVSVSASASSTATTAASSGAVTTLNANDLIIGAFCMFDGPSTVGSGYTSRASFYTLGVEDKIVSVTGSNTATWTSAGTNGWAAQLVAFKAAGVSVSPSVSPNPKIFFP